MSNAARIIGRAKSAIAAGEVGEVELDFGVARTPPNDHPNCRCEAPPRRTTWINPAWRWYHGNNHEIDEHSGLCCAHGCTRYFGGFNGGVLGDRNEIWFGVPKPQPLVWDAANHLSERFSHVRDHAWLEAIAYEQGRWTGTLAEVQANMPEWPTLFAFHAWTAAWLAIGCGDAQEQEQLVYLDQLEERFVGDACRGRACEAKV
jgi:hypothetical protein